MVVVFFVTSADTGAMVVDMLASGGQENTPLRQRVFWAASMGLGAIALLLADGLKALQTATIASALPFTLALLFSTRGLLKALKLDATKRDLRYQALAISPTASRAAGNWQRRLRTLAMFPRRAHVARFIADVGLPACEAVADEWRRQGYDCSVEQGSEGSVMLKVGPSEGTFVYEIRPQAYATPSFVTASDAPPGEERKYFRAEVHLREGGQDHDVMGWSKDEVIGDILDHFERHMHYLHLVG